MVPETRMKHYYTADDGFSDDIVDILAAIMAVS